MVRSVHVCILLNEILWWKGRKASAQLQSPPLFQAIEEEGPANLL